MKAKASLGMEELGQAPGSRALESGAERAERRGKAFPAQARC